MAYHPGQLDAVVRSAAILLLVPLLALVASGCASVGPGLGNPPSYVEARHARPLADKLSPELVELGDRFQSDPSNARTALDYANALQTAGLREQALAVLEQTYHQHRGGDGLASEYGKLALKLGRIKLAEQILTEADDPMRPDWRTISARGVALGKLNQYDKAIVHFRRAQAVAPDEAAVINNLAMAYAATGHLSEAEGLMRRIAFRRDSTPRIRENLALILALRGRFDAAKQTMLHDRTDEETSRWLEQIRILEHERNRSLREETQPET